MYENGPSTYIEMLFASGSFSEFASNVEIIKNLLDYDEKVLEERKQVREVIAQQKAELDAVRAEQETRRQTLSEKQASLTTKQQTQAAVISQLAQQEQMILNQTKEQMAKEKQLQQRINQSRAVSSVSAQTYKSSPSVTTAKAVFSGSASGSEAVRIAKSYIGVPYVYGGTTPNGFDCSGFVQYVYRQMGISINRVAADQAKNGTYVSKENLQPGDLVFFAKPRKNDSPCRDVCRKRAVHSRTLHGQNDHDREPDEKGLLHCEKNCVLKHRISVKIHRKKHLQFIKKCGIICFGIKEWEFSHSFVLYNKNRGMRNLSKAEEIAEREAEAICSGCGLYVYDVEYKKEGGENVLRVFIDSDSGVTLDDCEKVSRALSDRLDELDPIKGAYELENFLARS